MAMQVPLIGAPQQPPTFPQTNINVNTNGMQVTTLLAPGLAFSVNVGPDALDNVVAMWKEEKKKRMDIARAISNGKGEQIE
jgi:hypothetical protein